MEREEFLKAFGDLLNQNDDILKAIEMKLNYDRPPYLRYVNTKIEYVNVIDIFLKVLYTGYDKMQFVNVNSFNVITDSNDVLAEMINTIAINFLALIKTNKCFETLMVINKVYDIDNCKYNPHAYNYNALLIGALTSSSNDEDILRGIGHVIESSKNSIFPVFYNSYRGEHLFYICNNHLNVEQTIIVKNFQDKFGDVVLDELKTILKDQICFKANNGYYL